MGSNKSKSPPPSAAVALQRHWRRVCWCTLAGVLVWLGVSWAVVWWAHALNQVSIAGIPAGFWWASQGGIGAFLLIILVHGWVVSRLEQRQRQHQQQQRQQESQRVVSAATPESHD